jgi:Lon protease-like protein
MLADALEAHRMFSVAMRKPGSAREAPCQVAGLGLIRVSVGHRDGTSHLILQGLARVRLREAVQVKPYRVHAIQALETPVVDNVVVDALSAKVFELVEQRLSLAPFLLPFPSLKPSSPPSAKTEGPPLPGIPVTEVVKYLKSLPDAAQVADLVSCALLPGGRERQKILECVELDDRLRYLIRFLMAECARLSQNSAS